MTDLEEQQKQEVEALEAIYSPDELTVEEYEYPNIIVRFHCVSSLSSSDENESSLDLVVRMPAEYPDVVPDLTLEDDEECFCEEDVRELRDKLISVAEENTGMGMVFTIISAMQEEIGHLIEQRIKSREKDMELEKKKKEEAETKRFRGTTVTADSFRKWKEEFDRHRAILKEKQIQEREAALAGKLTGRQLFLQDRTTSDTSALEAVQIDESLFEELEGLDLDDDLLSSEDEN